MSPPVSRKQAKFMRAVAGGEARDKPEGLSRREAQEYVGGHPTKHLPERTTPPPKRRK